METMKPLSSLGLVVESGLDAQISDGQQGLQLNPFLSERLGSRGLEWEDLESLALRVAAVQIWVTRHLRPRVTVTTGDVEEAYVRVIVEPMQRAGATPPSLAHVNEDLRRLVAEEKLNAEIERWLDQCRERHRVTRFVE